MLAWSLYLFLGATAVTFFMQILRKRNERRTSIRLDCLSTKCWQVLNKSIEIAKKRGFSTAYTDDLLLAILSSKDAEVAAYLSNSGLDVNDVLDEVEQIYVMGELPLATHAILGEHVWTVLRTASRNKKGKTIHVIDLFIALMTTPRTNAAGYVLELVGVKTSEANQI